VSTDKIEVGFAAEDATGNTGWMTGKGLLVDSFTPSSPPPPPSIVIKQPLDGATYQLGQSVPASYSCTSIVVVTDCHGPAANGSAFDTTSVGQKTFTVSATPIVGQQASKAASYTVVYNFGGFQAPISSTALNVVKAGSTVPVTFSLHGSFGLGVLTAGYPQSGTIPCNGGTVDTGLSTTSPGNSSLSYDTTSGAYTYTWQTQKAWANTCRQLVVVLNDGAVHRANFEFK